MALKKNYYSNTFKLDDIEGDLFKLYIGDKVVMVLPGQINEDPPFKFEGIASEVYKTLATLAEELGYSHRIESVITGNVLWEGYGNDMEIDGYKRIEQIVKDTLCQCSYL